MSKQKVFVVNFSEQDLTDAERFGEIVFLTEGRSINIFNVEGILSDVRPKLADAKIDDYLLLCGSPVLNAIFATLMMFKFGSLNMLIFDAKTRTYTARTVSEVQLGGYHVKS